MLFWIIVGAAVYIVGASLSHIIDGWYDFADGDDDGKAFITFLWPIALLILPFAFADMLHNKLKAARKRKDAREAEQVKIRIADEASLKSIQDQVDRELALEYIKSEEPEERKLQVR